MDEIKNKRILVVDDEKELLKMMKDILSEDGFFNIFTAESCAQAMDIVKNQSIAMCILDVNLPDGSGFSLFNQIREFSKAPIIFLTARGEADDKIQGLGLGADDYIVKPFLAKELLLRIGAVLRRTYMQPDTISKIKLGNRYVNFETATVESADKDVPITAKEFILIKKLYENKNRIVTNDTLCMAAWGDNYFGYENTLMVHIRRLREKIEENPSKPEYLITVKGLGYKLVIEDE